MECRDAQFYLRLRRHATDELGSDVSLALDGHLATCRGCAADARAAVSFDLAMACAMRAVPVPSGLREQLVRHVASKQGAILRRKVLRGGSLVAAALVLVALGLSVFSGVRPKVDTEELARGADEQLNNPEESTRKWLAEHKLPDRLPKDFDYDLLIFRGFEDVKGKNVPVVVFRAPEGNGFAKVYIFRHDGAFDRKGIQDAQASHAGAEVEIRDAESSRGVTYVYVHTGGPNGLRPFLKFRKPGGLPL